MKNSKRKASKGMFILGIIGMVACIVSVITIITNPNVTNYQDFFERGWLTLFLFVGVIIPLLVSNISAFSSKSKDQ
jgi:hypothetical protein